MRLAVALLILGSLSGCGRTFYRESADKETYHAIHQRLADPRWALPEVGIEPPRESRLHDPYPPDHPPLPPDDPAAHTYMEYADGHRGYGHWLRDGEAPTIEDPGWRDYLGLDEKGVLQLTPERCVELGILHSREYQLQLERLYLTALSLTLNRFEFELQWFGRNNTFYDHAGNSSVPLESNTLSNTSELGFTRAFTHGGQLLVNLANSFVWEYTGKDSNLVMSNVVVNFVQPLLRGAGREVRLESLTQAERTLLYEVRDFARFRKEFYANLTTARGGGYLSLLLQVQNIRNFEADLEARVQNLRLHEALLPLGTVSGIQVDQVFQSYQAAQLSLLRAQTSLETALDAYKVTLGLPPMIKVRLDDAQLSPFQLNSPAITDLQDELEKFHAKVRKLPAAPSVNELREGLGQLGAFRLRLVRLQEEVQGEMHRWQADLGKAGTDESRAKREQASHQFLLRQMEGLSKTLAELAKNLEQTERGLVPDKRPDHWQALLKLIRQHVAAVAQLFVIQTQVRVFLIKLKPMQYAEPVASAYALANRLDLMNQRARVVDSWRQITVAADGLESDLNVVVNAGIGSAPDASHPFDFAALNSRYRVGLQFDGPLNRQMERNIYRASLVNYQQERRAYMARADGVLQAIRRDLRQLETERLSFEIARQSLITAARQVEAARDRLLIAERGVADTTGTQDIINAQNDLLQAKNGLIAIWVNYETARIQLLLDLEALQLDERGLYRDEHDHALDQPVAADRGPPGARLDD